ncbi:MAG: HD domain-containing protein [Oscillospiraceae bacterium]|nr:HD domain-containing protein [Oscillospiraceae bacterium]
MKYLLQISDLHLVNNSANWNNMQEAIVNNVREVLRDVNKGNKLLVLGGDFRFFNGSFDLAKDFISRLIIEMDIDPEKDVFLVPGNHDIRAQDADGRAKRIEDIKENPILLRDKKSDLMKDYSEFRDFTQEIGIYSKGSTLPATIHVRSWRNHLNILHLNTTLIADGLTKKDQRVDTATATSQVIRKALRKDQRPVIALGHNSFYDLLQTDKNALRGLFSQENISAYLCGDRHKVDTDPNQQMISLQKNKSVVKIPNVVSYRGSTDDTDTYSDFGMIWHIWDEKKQTVKLNYLRWDGEDQAELKPDLDGIKSYPLIIQQNRTIKRKRKLSVNNIFLQNTHLDKVAKKAYEENMISRICQNILKQQSGERKATYDGLCTEIRNSSDPYPLIIKGEPGVGKSTLLSSLFLNYAGSTNSLAKTEDIVSLDLHHYDQDSIEDAKKNLNKLLEQIRHSVNDDTIFFIDGINEYQRNGQKLQKMLLSEMSEWKKRGARFVLSIGTDTSQELPKDQSVESVELERIEQEAKIKVQLELLDTKSDEFTDIIKTVFSMYQLYPNPVQSTEKVSILCEKIDGTVSSFGTTVSGFRTVVFLAQRFLDYQQDADLFSLKCGRILFDYFSHKVLNEKKLQSLSRRLFLYTLGVNNGRFPEGQKAIQYRSAATRDFLFAYQFVSILKDDKEKDIQTIQNCDFILTPRINRFMLDLILEAEDQVLVANKIIKLYSQLNKERIRMKSQLAYLLGRMENSEAKKIALDFLLNQYREYEQRIDIISSNEMLVFRSIGISLLHLGNRDIRTEFLTNLIYNHRLRVVNRNFHVAYYTLSYKQINEYSLDDDSILTTTRYDSLVSILINSINSTSSAKSRTSGRSPCVSILTLIDLVIWKYNIRSQSTDVLPDGFLKILEDVSKHDSIYDGSLKEYISNIRHFLSLSNVYSDLLEKLYLLKTTLRAGWLEEGRDIPIGNSIKSPESVAEHTWACCLLAQIFLTEKLEDCDLMGADVISSREYQEYNYDKIIQMLMIHDLPEAITGDIPTRKKTDENREEERKLMVKLEARSVFRYLGGLRALKKLWDEYHGDTINAIIARDIDQIEALVQLYIYRELLSSKDLIAERDSWIQRAKSRIKSDFGKKLVKLIIDILLLDQYFLRDS